MNTVELTKVLCKAKCTELWIKGRIDRLTDDDRLMLIDLACDVTDRVDMPGHQRQLAYDLGLVETDICIEGPYPVATGRLVEWMDELWEVE